MLRGSFSSTANSFAGEWGTPSNLVRSGPDSFGPLWEISLFLSWCRVSIFSFERTFAAFYYDINTLAGPEVLITALTTTFDFSLSTASSKVAEWPVHSPKERDSLLGRCPAAMFTWCFIECKASAPSWTDSLCNSSRVEWVSIPGSFYFFSEVTTDF